MSLCPRQVAWSKWSSSTTPGLDHYFISADPAEIAVLDGGAFGGAWKRTGSTFPAWDVNGAPGNTVPVCRFFGTDQYRANGSRIGPNSHFYTADPAECALREDRLAIGGGERDFLSRLVV